MAIHPVFVHFHTGILTATAAVALVNLILRIFFRDNINTPGTRTARIFHQFDVFIYIGAIIGFLILMPFLTVWVLAFLLAYVAGIMVYISVDELLPAAHEYGHGHCAILGLILGMFVMALSLVML